MFDDESRETRRAFEPTRNMFGERTSMASGTERGMAFACTARGLPARAFGATPRSFFSTRTRAVAGTLSWDASLRGDDPGDSAACVRRSVVCGREFDWGEDRPPGTRLEDSVMYELHVKGFTKLHPHVPERLHGTYAGLAEPAVIDHLTRLGVTAVGLLPSISSFTTVRWSPGAAQPNGAIRRSTSSRPTTSTRRVVIAAARSTTSRRWSSLCTPRDSR